MVERTLTFREVYTILRDGVIDEDVRFQKTKRGEEVRFRIDRVTDSRPLAAIAVIAPAEDSGIYVITVMEVITSKDGDRKMEDGNDEH